MMRFSAASSRASSWAWRRSAVAAEGAALADMGNSKKLNGVHFSLEQRSQACYTDIVNNVHSTDPRCEKAPLFMPRGAQSDRVPKNVSGTLASPNSG
jgi:hypothetical protein